MRRKAFFLIVILLSICSLFAEETVAISWSHNDESVTLYRWKRGEGEWTITEENKATTFYKEGTTEVYHIEASYDGENWSDDHPVIITESETISISWSWINEGVKYHRWRLNDGEWHIVEDTNTGNIEITVGERYLFSVQSSYDGEIWSNSSDSLLTTIRVEKSRKKLPKLSFEAQTSISLSYAFYDFYNGHEIAGARYLTTTDPSFTADAELAFSIGKNFRFWGGYAYSRESKKETVIPDAFVVEHHQMETGFDVLFPIEDRWRLYFGLNSAYSIDVNAGYWSPSFFFGGRLGFDYFINKNFYVGIKSGVRVAHNDDNDPLYRSFTYLVDPIGLRVGVKF